MHVSLPSRRSLSYQPTRPCLSATPAAGWHFSPSASSASLIANLVLSCFFSQPALAQLAPQRQWAVFRQADGLLSNDVYSILADDGAIWFGTNKGVNRYDGQWRSFPISLIERAEHAPAAHSFPAAPSRRWRKPRTETASGSGPTPAPSPSGTAASGSW